MIQYPAPVLPMSRLVFPPSSQPVGSKSRLLRYTLLLAQSLLAQRNTRPCLPIQLQPLYKRFVVVPHMLPTKYIMMKRRRLTSLITQTVYFRICSAKQRRRFPLSMHIDADRGTNNFMVHCYGIWNKSIINLRDFFFCNYVCHTCERFQYYCEH